MEFIEKALSGGNEAAVLTAKSQLSKQLNQARQLADVKPCDTIFYTLQLDTPLNNERVSNLAHISKQEEEYKLSIAGGNFGQLDETYVNKKCFFVVSKKKFNFRTDYKEVFSSTPNTSNPTDFGLCMHKDCAQIRIMSPCSRNFLSMVIAKKREIFLFDCIPDEIGNYTIEIIINGKYIQGCAFAWTVKGFVISRRYTKMEDNSIVQLRVNQDH